MVDIHHMDLIYGGVPLYEPWIWWCSTILTAKSDGALSIGIPVVTHAYPSSVFVLSSVLFMLAPPISQPRQICAYVKLVLYCLCSHAIMVGSTVADKQRRQSHSREN
jgi:hypothetical protein